VSVLQPLGDPAAAVCEGDFCVIPGAMVPDVVPGVADALPQPVSDAPAR
jgi:hypothetical protein